MRTLFLCLALTLISFLPQQTVAYNGPTNRLLATINSNVAVGNTNFSVYYSRVVDGTLNYLLVQLYPTYNITYLPYGRGTMITFIARQ